MCIDNGHTIISTSNHVIVSLSCGPSLFLCVSSEVVCSTIFIFMIISVEN